MNAASAPKRLNAVWRDIARLFPAWSLPIDLFFSPSTWRLLGADLLPSIVKNRRARRAVARLEGVSAHELDALIEMARINVGRASDMFRTVAVLYISVPIALGALVSDTAPELVRDQLRYNLSDILYWLAVATITPAVYFCGMWRAKQLHWTLELHKTGAIEPLSTT